MTQPERLSQCLEAWMEQEDISVADLARMAGYKSKTSVFRLLKDQCNGQTMEAFVETVSPRLEEAWAERFRQALHVEKYGLQRSRQFAVIYQCAYHSGENRGPDGEVPLPDSGRTVYILGRPWKDTFSMVEGLLGRGFRVAHYMTEQQILDHPDLLFTLLTHVVSMDYQAVLPEKEPEGAWNLMATDDGQIFANGQWFTAGQADALTAALVPEGGTPLYRYDALEKGSDYIDFMESTYRMECSGAAVIAKQTPGIQMIPEDIVISALMEYLDGKYDPLSASLGTLRLFLRKRIENFYRRTKPTHLIFARKGMEHFMKTGCMTDQFYAMRPYTVDERIRILRTLDEYSRRDNVDLYVTDRKIWEYSMEAYENTGLLVYPAATTYNTQTSRYRELFLPGQAFYSILADMSKEVTETQPLTRGVGSLLEEMQR